MAFPNQHLYLTVHWHHTSSNIEEGQFGIRFDNSSMPSEANMDDVAQAVETTWATTGIRIGDDYRLDRIKIALIDTTGHYPDGHSPYVFDYSPVVPGGTSLAISQFPLQVAGVVSLTTAAARGRAHRGRCYLPALAGNLSASYQWSSTDTDARASSFAAMLEVINGFMGGPASVFSSLGTGTKRVVTGIAVGTRPDIQRRRAGDQVESYSVEPVT